MFYKHSIKKAFNYWQNKAPVHPYTCGNGCGNLKVKSVDKNGIMSLYCDKCDYTQKQLPDMVQNYYNQALKDRKLKIKPFFRWFDLWIGVYIDTKNDAVYIIPFPMFGIKIWWKWKMPFDEIFDRQ